MVFVWLIPLNPFFESDFHLFYYNSLNDILARVCLCMKDKLFVNWQNEKHEKLNQHRKMKCFCWRKWEFIHYYIAIVRLLNCHSNRRFYERGSTRIFGHWAEMTWQIHTFTHSLVLVWLVHTTVFQSDTRFCNLTDRKWCFSSNGESASKQMLWATLHFDTWAFFAFRAFSFVIQVNNVMNRGVPKLHIEQICIKRTHKHTLMHTWSVSTLTQNNEKQTYIESDRHSLTHMHNISSRYRINESAEKYIDCKYHIRIGQINFLYHSRSCL